jgi:hypothetical protein
MTTTIWMTCDFAEALVDAPPEALDQLTTHLFFGLMNSQAVSHLKRLAQPDPDPELTQWTPGILKFQVYPSTLSAVIALFKTQLPTDSQVITLIEAQSFRQTVTLALSQPEDRLVEQLKDAITSLQPD